MLTTFSCHHTSRLHIHTSIVERVFQCHRHGIQSAERVIAQSNLRHNCRHIRGPRDSLEL